MKSEDKALDTRSHKYIQSALSILRVEPDPILEKYFSEKNVDNLQNELIKGVKRDTGIKISRQSDKELLNMMIFMFENNKLSVLHKPVNTAVSELNTHVLHTAVPMVGNNASSQAKYINYISKPREPIPLGISTSSRGKQVHEYRPGL